MVDEVPLSHLAGLVRAAVASLGSERMPQVWCWAVSEHQAPELGLRLESEKPGSGPGASALGLMERLLQALRPERLAGSIAMAGPNPVAVSGAGIAIASGSAAWPIGMAISTANLPGRRGQSATP